MRSTFARSISELWTAEVIALVAGGVEAIALARLLPPSDLGVLTLAFAVPAFVFAVVDAQSQEAVTRYIAEFRARHRLDRVRAVVTLALQVDFVLVTLGLALTAILAPWVIDRFLDHRVSMALLLIAAIVPALALPSTTARAVLMADERTRSVAIARSAATVLEAVAVTVTVWAGGGANQAIIATALSGLVGFALVGGLATLTMRASFGGLWQRSSALGSQRKPILRFMAFTNASSLIATMAKDMDVLVLGYLTGAGQVGFYRVAKSVSRLSTFLIGPLQALTYTRFARLVASGDLQGLRSQVRRSVREVGLPLAGLTGLLMLAAPQLVRLAATSTYDPAITPLRWLLAIGAFLTATFWARPLLLVLDQVRFLLAATVVTTALAIPLYFMLTSAADAAGTASARAIATGLFGTGISALWAIRVLDGRLATGLRAVDQERATHHQEEPLG